MSSLGGLWRNFCRVFLHDIYTADTYWESLEGAGFTLFFLIHPQKSEMRGKKSQSGQKNEVSTSDTFFSWVYTCRNILKICQIFLQAKSSVSVKWWRALYSLRSTKTATQTATNTSSFLAP